MAGEEVTQGVGKLLAKQIRLRDGITPSSAYQSSDTLMCTIWAGDQQVPLAQPRVYWNPTIGPPDFYVDLVPGDTAELTPAVYSIGVVVNRPSTGQTATIWTSQLEVTPKPGVVPTPTVYITLDDLVTEMPSISSYQQQFLDETGFQGQRSKARKELDELIHRNIRGMSGITSSVFPSDYPYRFLVRSPVLQRYLDSNYLWLTQQLIDHQVFLTLGMIFSGQIPANPELFLKLSNHYRVKAELSLRGCTAEIHGPQNDGTGAGTINGTLLAIVEFSSTKTLRA